MNNVKQQELGNELQSSQHLRLQCVRCKVLDVATVPFRAAEVQLKKSITSIRVGGASIPLVR
jgi:phage FluMu protein Com